MDVGNFSDLHSVSNFVENIEHRQSYKIGCIEEIALNNGWIKKLEIQNAINFYGNCDYSNYLKRISR